MIKTIKLICGILLLSTFGYGQAISTVKIGDIETLLTREVKTVRIINFWATFCGPCIKELPQFELVNQKYKDKGVEIYLVSVDFIEDIEKVKKFVKRKQLSNKIMILDESDPNSWIDKVDKRWSGAIPATIILDGKDQQLIERELHEGELEKIVKKYIKP